MTFWTRYEKTAYDRAVGDDAEQELSIMATSGGEVNVKDDIAKEPEVIDTKPEKCMECIGWRRWWHSFKGSSSKDDAIPYEPYSTRMRWMVQKPWQGMLLKPGAILVCFLTVFLYGYFH